MSQAVRDRLDWAMQSHSGVRLLFESERQARNFRAAAHKLRSKERRDSCRTYPPGHVYHGASPYDALIFTLRKDEDGWAVYIRHKSNDIDGLLEATDIDDIEPR